MVLMAPQMRTSPLVDMIDKAPEERERGITISIAHIEYEKRTPVTTLTLTAPATPTTSRT